MKTTQDRIERISALLDRESATPDTEAALIESDAELAEQYRQYRRISELLHTLPDPEPSKDFVAATVQRLPHQQSGGRLRFYIGLAAAAAALLALAVGRFMAVPAPIADQTAAQSTARDMSASYIHLDVADADLFMLMPDTSPHPYELDDTLAYFETVHTEDLLLALAEMVMNEYAAELVAPDTAYQPDLWRDGGFDQINPITDVFLMLETLNNAETAALNIRLRDILAET